RALCARMNALCINIQMRTPTLTRPSNGSRFSAPRSSGSIDVHCCLLGRPESGRGFVLLPRCYQTMPNHADPRRTGSVPSVEIFELYIRVVFGGNTPVISLNQRVHGSSL